MFNGHTDTVEVTTAQKQQWIGDPWSGEIRDGNLFGRGSTDMKSGNTAFLWAAKVLRGRKPDGPLAANVEFYTAVLLDAVGLPREQFSSTFAVGRIAGWCAHVVEQRRTGKLIRPASRYVGPMP